MGTSLRKHQAGFSLVQVIVAIGIIAIVAAAFIDLTVGQQKALRGHSQKIDILEFRQSVIGYFGMSEVCSWQFQGMTIDVSGSPSMVDPSSTVLEFDRLYMGTSNTSPLLAAVGEKLSSSGYGVGVERIYVSSIYYSGVPNNYVGTLRVSWDQTSLSAPARALSYQLRLTVNGSDPLAARRIVSCQKMEESVPSEDAPSGYSEYFAAKGLPNFPKAVMCNRNSNSQLTQILQLKRIDPVTKDVFYVNPLQSGEKANYVVYSSETGEYVRQYNTGAYFDAATCPGKIEFNGADVVWKK